MDIYSDKKGVCRRMKEVAKLQIKDRTELFQAAAMSMGLQPDVIEKDFWVCFMLHHLFHDCKYKDAFVFKGGDKSFKSLSYYSKIFGRYRFDS